MLLRHQPSLPLSAFVDSIWYSERAALPHVRERSLPTGCADIVIPLRQDFIVRFESADEPQARHFVGAVVQGPHDRFSVRGMGGPSSVMGVHFKAGGSAAFFGGAFADLRNRTMLLEDIWGATAVELRQQLQEAKSAREKIRMLERHMLGRLGDVPARDSMVQFALDAFGARPSAASVAEVQLACGCTPAQFTRRFEAEVGLTPKRYARVLRFNALLPAIVRHGPRNWAALASASGYFDQAHLINEFKRISGVTPTAYAPVSTDQLSHVALIDY